MSTVDTTTDKEPTLHQLFFRAFHGQNNRLQPVRDELGLGRGQPKILTYLYRHGQSSQSDMARYFRTDPASISRMADILVRNGCISRCEDSECRRTNILDLTEKGRESARRWLEECKALDGIVLSGFTEDEVAEFKSMLMRILDNLDRRLDG